jgi:hypothetical protein
MAATPHKVDKELEQYRSLLEVPTKFDEGFTLSSFLGALFVALVMIPGALYMELVAGMGVGPAAQWVTVLLFIEVAKRANAKLSREQLFILFYMAGALVNQHVHGTPLFRQFLVRSDAAVAFGLADMFPTWVAPKDLANLDRSFFQTAWLPAIGLMAFRFIFSKIDNTVLGYGLFRLASDVEKLPFPLAPMRAQGMLTLADDMDGKTESSWRWRAFSIGGAIGLIFGFLYIGLPALTGAFLDKPLSIFPIPFVDLTTKTEKILPAVATGISFNLAQFVMGMVMPFFAMFGSFVGLIITFVANPILHKFHFLYSWQPGDKTVEVMFKNNLNFYFSLGIGLALSIAIVGVISVIRKRKAPKAERGEEAKVPEKFDKHGNRIDRGDMPNIVLLVVYLTSVCAYIAVSGFLIDWHKGVMIVMVFYAVIYTPLISYVTARLEGMAGQVVEIPFIKEITFILSGYKGIAVWFLPIPKANYGPQTVFYRTAELTGTRFPSIWKTDVFLFPIMLIALIGFSSFIWSLADIPSPIYPFTQEIWELRAKNACLIFSATLGEYSPFSEALNFTYIIAGTVLGLVTFGTLAFFSAPTTLCYGMVRGINQTLPHVVIPQFLGALLGRYVLQKRFGKKWKQYIIVVSAGYFVGSGLIPMLSIGIIFLAKATSALPY